MSVYKQITFFHKKSKLFKICFPDRKMDFLRGGPTFGPWPPVLAPGPGPWPQSLFWHERASQRGYRRDIKTVLIYDRFSISFYRFQMLKQARNSHFRRNYRSYTNFHRKIDFFPVLFRSADHSKPFQLSKINFLVSKTQNFMKCYQKKFGSKNRFVYIKIDFWI